MSLLQTFCTLWF